MVGGNLRHRSARKTNHQQPPIGGSAAQAGIKQLAADRIINHINTPSISQRPDLIAQREIRAGGIKPDIGPVIEGNLYPVSPACGGNDLRSGGLGTFDGGQPDSTGSAVNQHSFPRLQAGTVDQGEMTGTIGNRKGSSGGEVHAGRDGVQVAGGQHHLIGIAAVGWPGWW